MTASTLNRGKDQIMTDIGVNRLPAEPHVDNTDLAPTPVTTTEAPPRAKVPLLVRRPAPRDETAVDKSMLDETVLDKAVVETLHAAAYTVPTEQAEADGTASWDATTLVVVTVSAAGVTGTGWTYGAPAVVDVVHDVLRSVVVGTDVAATPAIWAGMVAAVRDHTRVGLCGYAVSAVDIALWDLKARLLGCSLSTLWGRVRQSAPIYASGAFTTFTTTQLDQQLDAWVDDAAIPRVKIKIGEARGTRTERDVARIRQTRRRVGSDTELYVDAAGSYTVKQAIRLMDEVEDSDVIWCEEPVNSNDLAGLRLIRNHVSADVAAGQYGSDLAYFARLCDAEAIDCVQIDATRAGGYTEWNRIAALAAAHHLEVSAHGAPNLHAHVGVATPNLRHLEYSSDHARIERLLFDHPLDPTGGQLSPHADLPGHGMNLCTRNAGPYRVR